MASSLLRKKSFCVITGASRGYGLCITAILSGHVADDSTFLLLARSKEQLKEVKSGMGDCYKNMKVVWKQFDQANLPECGLESVQNILAENDINPSSFEQVLIFHNAGTVGDLTKFAHEMTDSAMVEQAMNCNVSGAIVLNSSLLSIFTQQAVSSRVIVNVSSLAALQPFPSWSLYCAGKAARDMFFLTLAKEDSSLRILSYAPGPLDTDMQKQCRKCADDNLRQVFTEMKASGKLLKCEESVNKLIQLLEANTFESGAHIDFYDV